MYNLMSNLSGGPHPYMGVNDLRVAPLLHKILDSPQFLPNGHVLSLLLCRPSEGGTVTLSLLKQRQMLKLCRRPWKTGRMSNSV